MAGSVYMRKRRDGTPRWYLRLDVGTHPETGRRQTRAGAKRRGYATEREAEDALTVARAAVIQGTRVDDDRSTFGDYAEAWLAASRVGAQSRPRYTVEVRTYLIPRLGALRLAALSKRHVEAALAAWGRAGLGDHALAHLYARLRQILKAAVRDGLIARNPCEQVDPPRIERRERPAWTAAQLARFLALAADRPEYPLWRLYALSGMRLAEALGLRWRDVDWARGGVRVEQQVRYAVMPLDFGPPKSARGRRPIDLDPETLRLLGEHRQAQLRLRVAHPRWKAHDLVFPLEDGGIQDPRNVSARFTTMLARWQDELPRLTIHGLRHTHATLLMQEDGNVAMIAQRLGHDPAMLLRVYAHVLPHAQRRGVDRLLAALG